jgi:hypothetical protein
VISNRRGAALIIVLMALAVLFALGVPFLFASRTRAESSNESFDRVRAILETEAAGRTFAQAEARSHPSIDPTPLFDSVDEYDTQDLGVLPQNLGGGFESSTASWGVEVENVQGRISLATAPMMLLQNLLHPCYLSKEVTYRDSVIEVTSTEGFAESGLVLIGTQWVQYTGKEDRRFTGVLGAPDPPQELDEIRFREGQPMIDPRVFSLVLSRFNGAGYSPPSFLADLLQFQLGGADSRLNEQELRRLENYCMMSTGAFGTSDWEPAGWMTREINPEIPELLSVNDGSLFNRGSLIRMEGENGQSFHSMVLAAGGGRLLLAAPIPPEFERFRTRVMALRREPIDINACRPEILKALALGVGFRGSAPVVSDRPASGRSGREWVNPTEANRFAVAVQEARPIQGPADLWQRVLSPMAEAGAMSDLDAWALYVNGIDPNHGSLASSTVGYAYRSGDRYRQRVNAAVRSRLGRSLARASFLETMWAAPDGPLLDLLQDQESFEDRGRYSRSLHGMTLMPNNLGNWINTFGTPTTAPSLQMGTLQELGLMFPDKEPELSSIMPETVRRSDAFPRGAIGRVEHFDYEPSPLGRSLTERGPYRPPLEDWGVVAGAGTSDNEPLAFEGWFYAENGLADGALMDLSGFQTDRNRVTVAFEQGELVVRCRGTAGEDPADPDGLEEAIVVRIDPAEYPLLDRWFHVGVLLRANSPRGIQVTIDGVPRGEIDGYTHLTAALSSTSPGDPGGIISVESTEGFPNRGAIRIGDEIIEYVSKTETTFVADRNLQDAFGGRAVREATDTFALALDSSHPVGSAVEIYGYSAILDGDIAPGGARTTGTFGPWSMASSIEGPETIIVEIDGFPGFPIDLGQGINASYVGPIELTPLEQVPEDNYYAEAFQTDGGYALMWQGRLAVTNAEDGSRFGGMEVVRYSGREGTTLTLSERNVQTPGIADAPNGVFSTDGNSYVMLFQEDILVNVDGGTPANDLEILNVYIMPISVHVAGATDLSYRSGDPELSEFVQLTHEDDPGQTEWVRYDSILNGNFLRDDWGALNRAIGALFDDSLLDEDVLPGGPPPGPNQPGPDAPTDAPSAGLMIGSAPIALSKKLLLPEQDPEDDMALRPTLGAPEERDEFITAILERYHFRGVMGTFDHEHEPGIEAVPVFTVRRWRDVVPESEPSFGFVGRHDRVAVMEAGNLANPFWFTVMWSRTPDINRGGVRIADTYVAFTTAPGIPFLGSDFSQLVQQGLSQDLRNFNRICKFPNQERPLALTDFTVGGDATGTLPEFQGMVDEVAMHTVAGMGTPTLSSARGAFILDQDLLDGETSFIEVDPIYVVVDGLEQHNGTPTAGAFLSNIPTSGLLDIDGERVAYVDVDTSNGQITLATDGRGLHGTEIRGHSKGARIFMVDDRPSSTLTRGMSQTSAEVEVEDATGFGLYDALLIDDELVHAPMRRNSYLTMPRVRGLGGTEGNGLLRGRFGTTPEPHAEGTLVYAMPTRWAHTYASRSDSGAHARFDAAYEAPGGYWKGVSYTAEIPDPSIEYRVLARVNDVNWEGDPSQTPGLIQVDDLQADDSGLLPLHLNGDRMQLRFQIDWLAGAFNPVDFQATGWTQAPRLRSIFVDYLAEAQALRRQEVQE